MKDIIIAIDGPAGSGKSTTARLVAQKLGYIYIDTGAMYRAVTLAFLKSGLEYNEQNICNLLEQITISLNYSPQGQITLLNGEDVSEAIRANEVTNLVSPISAINCVRHKLVKQQQMMGQNGGVVMDGRDIGTVVFPNAQLKIFLIASIEARTKRRQLELKQKGIDLQFEQVRTQIIERDIYDSTREISPLKKADDAIEIDTTNLTIQEQTDLIVSLAQKKILELNNA